MLIHTRLNFQFALLPWCFHSTKHALSLTPNLLEGSEPARISCPWLLLDGERLPSPQNEPVGSPHGWTAGAGGYGHQRDPAPLLAGNQCERKQVTCARGAGRAKAQELITQVASGPNNPWETGKIRCNCCSFSSTQSYTKNTNDPCYRSLTTNRAGFGSGTIWLCYHLRSYLQAMATT